MKKFMFIILVISGLFTAVLLSGWGEMFYRSSKLNAQIRSQAATIARQELVIDSLRNPVDTTEFLTEHSELKP